MNVPLLLEELRRRNIQVWGEGDQLRCSAPTGALTAELRDQLGKEKNAILQFLRSADALALQERAIVPLQPLGRRTPVFAVPGHNGNVFSFRNLSRQLGDDQPFFGLQPPGVEGECEPLERVEEVATYFATRILAFRPEGPYTIAGHCAGGGVAFELAHQLEQRGATVTFVALFGSPYPAWFRSVPQLLERIARRTNWFKLHLHAMASLTFRERGRYIRTRLAERRKQRHTPPVAVPVVAPDPVLAQRVKIEKATIAALRQYDIHHYSGRLVLFLPCKAWQKHAYSIRWRGIADEVEEYFGPDGCRHDIMLHEPYVRTVAEQFQHASHRVQMKVASPALPERLPALVGPRGA